MASTIIHAGFHKTGTTSLQSFLRSHRPALNRCGTSFYRGMFRDGNHVELHAYAMRPERPSGFKTRNALKVDDAFQKQVTASVRCFVENNFNRNVLFSNEGVSLLRYPDEFERLAKLLDHRPLRFLFVRRDAEHWWRSYCSQVSSLGFGNDVAPDHFANVGPDSWLRDIDGRLDAFRGYFGADSVSVVDYDEAVRAHGNIVPAFCEALGISGALHNVDVTVYRSNRSVSGAAKRNKRPLWWSLRALLAPNG